MVDDSGPGSVCEQFLHEIKIMNIHAPAPRCQWPPTPRCKQPTQSLAKPHSSRRIRPKALDAVPGDKWHLDNLILPISNGSEYC
jgi:hypothetical protein